MEIYTSYFYQVRHFKPNCFGFSSALSDPKWFHNFENKHHVFLDKNGVVNGLRADPFVPGPLCENLCSGPKMCADQSPNCLFLQQYYNQLKLLDVDIIVQRFQQLGQKISQRFHIPSPPFYIILVHEAPSNPCSERWPLQMWLQENHLGGQELTF